MKVSVCLFAYNHAPFIAEAIESALMQETDFDFEIVIGEDASTDGTRRIVEDYARRYPDRVRSLLHPKNLGGGGNTIETWRACRGSLIALLDGDDYWTSRHKLQRQSDAMDAHPDWTMCFHRVRRFSLDTPSESSLYPPGPQKPVLNVRDLLESANPIQTCSVVYRGGVVPELPGWFRELGVGDWPLHVLHAVRGDVGFLDEVMADYRIHAAGVWARRPVDYREEQTAAMFRRLALHLRGDEGRTLLERSHWLTLSAAVRRLMRWELRSAQGLILRGLSSSLLSGLPLRHLWRALIRWRTNSTRMR